MLNQQTDNAIASHEIFADQAALSDLFARVRREDPLHWTQAEGNPAFWAVTKHADLVEVGRQNEAFINGPMIFLRDDEEDRIARTDNGGKGTYLRTLVNMDMPDHRNYRGLTQAWFMPTNIKRLDGLMKDRAVELVDKLASMGGRCDFVKDIAIWYPLRVIMSLLGVPEVDHPMLLQLAQQILAPKDPILRRKETGGVSAKAAVVRDFFDYFGKVVQDRRANPRDDLSSLIANLQVDGQPIGQMEVLSYFMILATAGHDTTSTSLAGGLLALMHNPAELAKLRADPALLNTAVDEMFRWVSPVRHFMRTATADYELRGKTVKKDDLLMLSYYSANRDEDIFTDPQLFQVGRTPNRHVAFGFGAHACLGQNLARAELKIFFKELLARVEHVEIDGSFDWVSSNQVSGPRTLPIRYRMS